MDTHGIIVIEAPHFGIEVERLMKDPVIVTMAEEIHDGIRAGAMPAEWLESHEAMTAAMRHAQDNSVPFESIGGPIRAILQLVNEYRKQDAQ